MQNKLILLIFLLSAIGTLASTTHHQYYIPVEDSKIDKFIESALKDLKFFGDFAYSVNEIHIRISKRAEKPYLLTRADIIDWPGLKKQLDQLMKSKKFFRKYLNYSEVKIDTLSQKRALIKHFNKMLNDKEFYSEKRFPDLKLSDQQQKWAGPGLFG